jgi:eukaryotic-like serine/threonine-protein kinase
LADRTISLPLSRVNDEHRIVAGRYEIRALIAQGGMGAVYAGVDRESGRRIALKMLLPDLPDAARVAERFRREARAASLLDHPNIVEVLDLVSEGDELYLVMELLEGRSVAKLVEAGALPVRRALVIARQVLEGLAHAHAAGLIHRDIKPDNLVVVDARAVGAPDGRVDRVKLLDFGVVKLVGEAAGLLGDTKLTASGMVFGTPAYIAPEQALGLSLDHRADLYALGVVLFEMLAGRPPFRSPDRATLLRMHAAAPPPTLASVLPNRPWITPALEELVRRVLAKRPDDRFADATAMLAALDAAFLSLDHLPAGT